MRRHLIAITSIAFLPGVALAAAPRNFQELVNFLVTFLNNAIAVLVVLGLVVYFYGVSTSILKAKTEGTKNLKGYFFWGIIILFVMVSIWGILQILQNTLFGGDQFSPNTGTNYLGQQGQFQTPQLPVE